jgi:hypothetical protein
MQSYQAIRKDRAATFAEVIAFPSRPDLNQGLRKLVQEIEAVSKAAPAARDIRALKPENTAKAARRTVQEHRRPLRARALARATMFSAVALASVAAGWALSGYYLDAHQRSLDSRVAALAQYALAPGSPLACLGGYAGEMVESSCEDVLFATPQAAAAAVSYVAAELSLLADAENSLSRDNTGYGPALIRLRHLIEMDRFGFAAHVLSIRDGCTPDRCRAFSLLHDSRKISANLSEHTYQSYVARHLPRWQMADISPPSIASLPGETGLGARSGVGDANRPIGPKLNLPPSIPPVSIMDPETPPSRKR